MQEETRESKIIINIVGPLNAIRLYYQIQKNGWKWSILLLDPSPEKIKKITWKYSAFIVSFFFFLSSVKSYFVFPNYLLGNSLS